MAKLKDGSLGMLPLSVAWIVGAEVRGKYACRGSEKCSTQQFETKRSVRHDVKEIMYGERGDVGSECTPSFPN
jgi:hypothetical protein